VCVGGCADCEEDNEEEGLEVEERGLVGGLANVCGGRSVKDICTMVGDYV
jgi:hypothetical protein